MKNLKSIVVLALFALALAVPVAVAPHAHAEPTNLLCRYNDGEFSGTTSEGCDLVVTKKVSINGGAPVDANSADTAAKARVGDSVQWQIVVSDNSIQGNTPFGIVTLHDVLPAGVTAGSSTATTGIYDAGDWVFTLGKNVPATLTINSTATTTGLVKNTAELTDYNPDNCDGPCVDPPFHDSDDTNNVDVAYVNVVADPVVPAVVATPPAPTLVNTGTNPLLVMFTAFTIAAAAIVVFNFDKVKAEVAKFRG